MALSLILTAASPAGAVDTKVSFTVTEIGSLSSVENDQFDPFGTESPGDINNSGTVLANAASSQQSFASVPYVDEEGAVTPLGTPALFTSAAQINDRGEVVGYAASLDDPDLSHVQAVVWRDGQMSELPEFDVEQSQAYGINEAGAIVGNASVNSADGVLRHAAMWNETGLIDLGTLGGPGSNASGINDAGDIVGYSMVDGRTGTFPTVWRGGVPAELESPDGRNGGAVAINNDGTIIGALVDEDFNFYPVKWTSGKAEYLPLISDKGEGSANGINASGLIVGWTKRIRSDAGVQVAVLWDGDSVLDLNKSIELGGDYELREAVAINDAGQIAVSAIDPDGERHALVLNPIDPLASHVGLQAKGIGQADLKPRW